MRVLRCTTYFNCYTNTTQYTNVTLVNTYIEYISNYSNETIVFISVTLSNPNVFKTYNSRDTT